MPRRAEFAALAAAVLLCAACAPHDRKLDASHLASLWVKADTMGDWEAADSLVAPCDSEMPPAPNEPMSRVVLRPPAVGTNRDTLVVLAIYQVLGTAYSEDPVTVGQLNWRFDAFPHADTTILRMAADSTGRLWIACGEFAPNHRALSQMVEEVNALDSASRVALEAAKLGKTPAPAEESQ